MTPVAMETDSLLYSDRGGREGEKKGVAEGQRFTECGVYAAQVQYKMYIPPNGSCAQLSL